MSRSPTNEVSRILGAASNGDARASEQLLPLVYDELRRLAASQMSREPAGHTMQPTALVHEAYLRLVGDGQGPAMQWNSRAHFFGAAAQAMRRILVERARRQGRIRHGGGLKREALSDDLPGVVMPDVDMVGLDEALTRLEAHNPRVCSVVMLRYFAGLSIEDTVLRSTHSGDRWQYSG